jgi:glutaredoxin
MIFFSMLISASVVACLCRYANAYSPPSPTSSPSVQTILLEWFKNSELVARLHAEHVASPQVQHMMKSTQLVKAADDDKLRFAGSFMGRLVSDAMAKEQQMLGNWKVQKIIEAATPETGVFDIEAGHNQLLNIIERAPITLFSFVDCPWCLLAKKLLQEEPYRLDYGIDGDNRMLQIVELEDLEWKGKELRASIALATGRTSMPACFIGGLSIGGFTDGFEFFNDQIPSESLDPKSGSDDDINGEMFVPSTCLDLRLRDASGIKDMHETGRLQNLIEQAQHVHNTSHIT